ncbi:MAG: DNA replication/repair protein RecF [Oscillospiraceae bacterium]|nr:DNA replication/repair protein RecF [Oscillospiraceae bacterium]
MKLNQLSLTDYRNIRELSLFPCGEINVVYGDNAQGKTNLIEALWLFTGNPSFRGAKTGELIRFGAEDTRLSVRFEDARREQLASLCFSAKGNRRKILLNGVELKTTGELNGNFYGVVFSPSHLSFVQEGPKNRRKFLDIAISEIRPQYKDYLNTYEKLLEQRNALLKNAADYPDLENNIDVWDLQLAKAGTVLSIYRNDYVRRLSPITREIYEGLSRGRERFELRYSSTVYPEIGPVDSYQEEWVRDYYQKLKEGFRQDLRQGFTGAGIHRDDLEIQVDGMPVRTYGSQGQQRSSVIALKLAEASLLKKATGENPIMLLDDVMSELDESRQDYILNHLKGMQVFITCCDISNAARLKSGRIFRISQGTLAEEADRA